MTFDPENSNPPGAKIKVIGVGGGGGNAVNTMIRSGLDGVDFITCNTDVQALRYSLANHKIQVGKELTRGLGAGADPDIGRDAALEDKTEIQNVLRDTDMVFITAGMGGGTGTGGAAVVAQLARELGALTVAVVTKPFTFEGKRRRKQAEAGIARLRESVDTLITIPNQRLLQVASPDLSMIDAFKMADEVLVNAVRGISDIINIHGMLNVDFADVKTVMSCMGQALMGIGSGRGDKRAVEAALMAISSPLLEEVDIEGATGILINITGGTRVTMHEINEACGVIQEAAHEDANIIFGAVIDESLGDELRVTVIATGFPVDKAEGDADPTRGKPYSSPVASRLASAAGKSAVQHAPMQPEPPKKSPVPEPALEIEDIPQSPYDDLAFSSPAKPQEPVPAMVTQAPPPAIAAQPIIAQARSEAPQDDTTSPPTTPVTEVLIPKVADQAAESASISASQFASSSAEEAQELARWTLDFSAADGLNLADDIPSLAGDVEQEPDLFAHAQGTPHQHDVALASPTAEAAPVEEDDVPAPSIVAASATAHHAADHAASTLAVATEADETLSVMDRLDVGSAETDASVVLDPKDEFVSTVTQTMASSSLADTLFDADFSHSLGDEIESSLSLLDTLQSDENLAGDKATGDLSLRQGATKAEPAYPTSPIHHDDLALAEIDRKIDEALDLADRMRASRQQADADDLDVPSFLRANMKDLPLD